MNAVVNLILRFLGHVQDVGLTNLGCVNSIIMYQANAELQSLTLGEVHLGREHIPDMVGNRQLIRKPVLLKHNLWKVRT